MLVGLPKAPRSIRYAAPSFLPYAGINRIRFNGSTLVKRRVSGAFAAPRNSRDYNASVPKKRPFTAAWPLLLLPGFLFLRMAMNVIDGMLAREHDRQHRLGGLLNELGDGLSDAALYLPLALVPGFDPVLVVLIVVCGLLAELAGVLGVIAGSGRRYDGPMGKSDRAFVFGALALWAGLGGTTAPGADWILILVLALSVVTIFNRSRQGVRSDDPA
jgi:CDP-diacylglycerol--glycerol-3-phosphate 3-phosphatidyltransferase